MTWSGLDAVDRLAALEAAELRPERDAEPLRELAVEVTGPPVLDQREAERRPAVADLEAVTT